MRLCIFLCRPCGNQSFTSPDENQNVLSVTWHFPHLHASSLNTRQGWKKYAGNFLVRSVPLSQPLIYTAWTESVETDFPLSRSIYNQLTGLQIKWNSTYSIQHKGIFFGWRICFIKYISETKSVPLIIPFTRKKKWWWLSLSQGQKLKKEQDIQIYYLIKI